MFKLLRVGLGVLSVLVLLGLAGTAGAQGWYQVSFTGADIWTYSADNALQSRTDQAAPRRYRDWTQSNPLQATTYGLNGGLPGTGFGTWAPGSGYAFDEINLWGKDGLAASWGEKYIADPDNAHNGITSWNVLASPTGWTNGIVLGNQSYNGGPGAFPVWRSGTGAALGLANMGNPDFKFTFQVLISNPLTAFEPDGSLRVWFGGFRDDLQGTGLDNYEVSGVMDLAATAVPEPSSLLLLGGIMAGLGVMRLRKRS